MRIRARMASRSVPTPRVASSNLLWGAKTFWHQVITKHGVEHSALEGLRLELSRFYPKNLLSSSSTACGVCSAR
jgi:hypothetical protein